ncbi:MAG: guanylate kinase [Holophagaceae bacterium]|nr:guanylate kinase [Holophagaceae bacterium]
MACIGDIFVLSAPSGTGKSTLINRLFADIDNLSFSVSYTTRAPRVGESDGRDYFFVNNAEFDKMLADNDLVEWVQVYQHRYGTGRTWIHNQIDNSRDVLLDLETAGAKRIKEIFPEATLIFLLPPSAQSLANRLRGRGKDTEEQISIRLQSAKREIDRWNSYDHLILNDDIDIAYQEFKSIFISARVAKKRMEQVAKKVLSTF